jgi:hypothetical protein
MIISVIKMETFCVGQCTKGFKGPEAGLGASLAAFSFLLSRLNLF